MEPTQAVAGHEVIDQDQDQDQDPVHQWRVTQLKRLGIPAPLAEADADKIDWHQIADLVQRGCPPRLALRIIR
jgi:hypothetical protein